MPDLRPHPSVHAEHDDLGGLVLLHRATGQWHSLNPTAALWWAALADTGNTQVALDTVIAEHPDTPPDELQQDLAHLIAELTARELLTHSRPSRGTMTSNNTERQPPHEQPPEAGLPMALPTAGISQVPPGYRVTASLAFLLALALLRLPYRITSRVIAGPTRRLPAATHEQGTAAVHAAHAVARGWPGRAACLELSLTAVLTAALRGRRLHWCFGFATDPRRFHAWVETADGPVTHPADEPVTAAYRRILAL